MQNTDLESLCHPTSRDFWDYHFMEIGIVNMIDSSEWRFELWTLLQSYFDEYVEGALDAGIAANDFMRDKAVGIIKEAGYVVDLDEELIYKA